LYLRGQSSHVVSRDGVHVNSRVGIPVNPSCVAVTLAVSAAGTTKSRRRAVLGEDPRAQA
jgi:hypothetical protein